MIDEKNEHAALVERYYQAKTDVLEAETCLSATLSINNLLWTAQELNPDRGLTAYTTAQPLKTKIIVNFTFKDPVRTAQ